MLNIYLEFDTPSYWKFRNFLVERVIDLLRTGMYGKK
jgi:hypothetical protein